MQNINAKPLLICLKYFNRKAKIMTVKRLKFNKENCIGCQLCMLACSGMHEGVYALHLARLEIESYYEQGEELKFEKHICSLCGVCKKQCPVNAITIIDKVSVDRDTCTGCGICAEKCAFKAIKLREEKAVICDTCDGDPWCVKMCPHGALSFE
ncbi:4Fe-4S binding protein [Sinanaerobacter chloroacetimidivorans]|jgi:carbon-monoxide dehydrogenase iron sulfur subunit|uniref:4Fe-4S binding protein n=1 Tax=Sinanaerobacter chloroacetimidivorans TaxID=2818044 RepID=A0A8J7W2W3_9FIRM|nr:4Fe-4S binding protein [Sinanaerobacter chloroacetimidivorans]MBR0598393.1 4Fe-4S binding protein [Sinanaerobacter chloroacetimidivorans]